MRTAPLHLPKKVSKKLSVNHIGSSTSHQSCRRKAGCRFKYPQQPSPSTLISHEPQENCQQQIDFAVKILRTVKEVLQNIDLPLDITLDEVLTTAHVTLDDCIKALSISKCGQSVILKRQPYERNVNCYSPVVLKAWQANMDIQYVINAYACVMYIASYVLKADKGMGELLKQAAKEIQQGNTRQQLNQTWISFSDKSRSQCPESSVSSLINTFKEMQ